MHNSNQKMINQINNCKFEKIIEDQLQEVTG